MPSGPENSTQNAGASHHLVLAASVLTSAPDGARRLLIRTEGGAAVLVIAARLAAQIAGDLAESEGPRAAAEGQSAAYDPSLRPVPRPAAAALLAPLAPTAAGTPDRRESRHAGAYAAILRALALDPALSVAELARARGISARSFYAWRSNRRKFGRAPITKPSGRLL